MPQQATFSALAVTDILWDIAADPNTVVGPQGIGSQYAFITLPLQGIYVWECDVSSTEDPFTGGFTQFNIARRGSAGGDSRSVGMQVVHLMAPMRMRGMVEAIQNGDLLRITNLTAHASGSVFAAIRATYVGQRNP